MDELCFSALYKVVEVVNAEFRVYKIDGKCCLH